MDKNDWIGLYQFNLEIAAGLQQRDEAISKLQQELQAEKAKNQKELTEKK